MTEAEFSRPPPCRTFALGRELYFVCSGGWPELPKQLIKSPIHRLLSVRKYFLKPGRRRRRFPLRRAVYQSFHSSSSLFSPEGGDEQRPEETGEGSTTVEFAQPITGASFFPLAPRPHRAGAGGAVVKVRPRQTLRCSRDSLAPTGMSRGTSHRFLGLRGFVTGSVRGGFLISRSNALPGQNSGAGIKYYKNVLVGRVLPHPRRRRRRSFGSPRSDGRTEVS